MRFSPLKQQAVRKIEPGTGIYFGGLPLPPTSATSHFMIVGSTGSGKTLTLRMMMGSVLPTILTRADQRAVVFDVKQDAISILYGILADALKLQRIPEVQLQSKIEERVLILNPFDSRCHSWDMAADIRSPEVSLQIATILIPEEHGQNRYFSDAARDLLNGIIQVFIDKKSDWCLADLLFAMRSPDRMRHVLKQTDEGLGPDRPPSRWWEHYQERHLNCSLQAGAL